MAVDNRKGGVCNYEEVPQSDARSQASRDSVCRLGVRGTGSDVSSGSCDRIGHGRKTENRSDDSWVRRSQRRVGRAGRDHGVDRGDHRHSQGHSAHQNVHLERFDEPSVRRNSRVYTRAVPTILGTVLVFFFLLTAVSGARTYSPKPPGGGLVENPDGTWSLYGEDADKPLRVYTSAEHAKFEALDQAMDIDAGSGANDAKDVEGITKTQREFAKEMDERLQTGELYKNPAEQELGEELASDAEVDGTLPAWSDTLTALGTGGAEIGFGAAAAYVGVEIGNGVDRLLGLPELEIGHLFSNEDEEPACNGEHGPHCEKYRERQKWGNEAKVKQEQTCTSAAAGDGQTYVGSTEDRCLHFSLHHDWTAEELNKEKEFTYEKGADLDEWSEAPNHIVDPGHPETIPHVKALTNEYTPTGLQAIYLYVIPDHPGSQKSAEIGEAAFPKSGLKSLEKGGSGTANTIAPPTPLKTPIHPKGPEVAPRKVVEYIGVERENDELPGIENPSEEAGEEKLGSPLEIELPAPKHDELQTEYEDDLKTAGFVNIEIETLGENFVDRSVGPDAVSSVEPNPNHKYDPETKVKIAVNPSTAPQPENSGIPSVKIGAITEPELKPPHLTVLCKNFPFGVPCWIVQEIEAWSATGKAPTLSMSSFTIKGKKIDGASVNLESLEPVMEKVRPFMVIFGTIGLILLFYKFATGGGPSGGSGGSDSGPDSGGDYSGMEGQ